MELLNFESLPLPDLLLKGIRDAEFKTCTPIQSKSLPITLARKDLAGQAQTGTGKTAAFLITLFTRLLENKPEPAAKGKEGPRALVLAPTRELARQIEKDALVLGKHCGFKSACIIGGVDYEKQRNQIKAGVDILIATPGRLIDFYKQRFFSLKRIEVLVVDEADRMFDMGFIVDLRYLFRSCSPYNKRQTMLFSATLPAEIVKLSKEFLNDPIQVTVTPPSSTVKKIEQKVLFVDRENKPALLESVLEEDQSIYRVLIFTRTKHGADRVAKRLIKLKIPTEAIHGNKSQPARLKALDKFRSGRVRVLVATDIASRGLDVDGITHVINYDLPKETESYVHRIGRTARAGMEGIALSFCDAGEKSYLRRIETEIGRPLNVDQAHPFHDESIANKKNGGRKPDSEKFARGRARGGKNRSTARYEGKNKSFSFSQKRSTGKPASRKKNTRN